MASVTVTQTNNTITIVSPIIMLDDDASSILSLNVQELGLATQAANTVLAGPVSGANAVPTFRSLVEADLGTTLSPTFAGLDLTGITDGNVPYLSANGFEDSPISISGNTVSIDGSGVGTALSVSGGPSSNSSYYGIMVYSEYVDTSTSYASMYGIYNDVFSRSSSATRIRALQSTASVSTGSISREITGAWINVEQDGGSTQDAYGIHVSIDMNGTVNGKSYVAYLDAQSNVDYGLYVNGGADNYLSGPLGIKVQNPSSDLDIAGNLRLTNDSLNTNDNYTHATFSFDKNAGGGYKSYTGISNTAKFEDWQNSFIGLTGIYNRVACASQDSSYVIGINNRVNQYIGHLDSITGAFIDVETDSGSSVDTAYGLRIALDTNGQVSSSYTLYINGQTNVQYNIYAASARDNYLGGPLGIKTTDPAYDLDVNGTARISQTLTLHTVSEPSTPAADEAILFLDSADGSLKVKFDTGNVVTIAAYT